MKLPTAPRAACASLLLTLLLAACFHGGSGNDNDDPAPGSGTANVTPDAGGTVTSADGRFTLTVPVGAVSEAVEITIRRLTGDEIPADIQADPTVFAVYDLKPDGLQLDPPATVTMQLPPEALAGIDFDSPIQGRTLFLRSSDGTVELLPGTMTVNADDTITLTGEVGHFSQLFGVVFPWETRLEPPSVRMAVGGTWRARLTLVPVEATASSTFFDLIQRSGLDNPPVLSIYDTTHAASGSVSTLGEHDLLGVFPASATAETPYVAEMSFRCDAPGEGSYAVSVFVGFFSPVVPPAREERFAEAECIAPLTTDPRQTLSTRVEALTLIGKASLLFANSQLLPRGQFAVLIAGRGGWEIRNAYTGEVLYSQLDADSAVRYYMARFLSFLGPAGELFGGVLTIGAPGATAFTPFDPETGAFRPLRQLIDVFAQYNYTDMAPIPAAENANAVTEVLLVNNTTNQVESLSYDAQAGQVVRQTVLEGVGGVLGGSLVSLEAGPGGDNIILFTDLGEIGHWNRKTGDVNPLGQYGISFRLADCDEQSGICAVADPAGEKLVIFRVEDWDSGNIGTPVDYPMLPMSAPIDLDVNPDGDIVTTDSSSGEIHILDTDLDNTEAPFNAKKASISGYATLRAIWAPGSGADRGQVIVSGTDSSDGESGKWQAISVSDFTNF